MIAIQPISAQSGVIILDMSSATDEELAAAMDAAAELEFVMRSDFDDPAEDPQQEEAADEIGTEEEIEAEESEESEIDAPDYAPGPEQTMPEDPMPTIEETAIAENEFLVESRRLAALADEAFEMGDYEAATFYAQEANRYALLSDAYVAGQMEAMADATEFSDGLWPLPATFTVRPWAIFRDSLWSIAGRAEIYGNPLRWPDLFQANRHIMPDPNNPNLILPGMVLEIPSIDGEIRRGEWQSDRAYEER